MNDTVKPTDPTHSKAREDYLANRTTPDTTPEERAALEANYDAFMALMPRDAFRAAVAAHTEDANQLALCFLALGTSLKLTPILAALEAGEPIEDLVAVALEDSMEQMDSLIGQEGAMTNLLQLGKTALSSSVAGDDDPELDALKDKLNAATAAGDDGEVERLLDEHQAKVYGDDSAVHADTPPVYPELKDLPPYLFQLTPDNRPGELRSLGQLHVTDFGLLASEIHELHMEGMRSQIYRVIVHNQLLAKRVAARTTLPLDAISSHVGGAVPSKDNRLHAVSALAMADILEYSLDLASGFTDLLFAASMYPREFHEVREEDEPALEEEALFDFLPKQLGEHKLTHIEVMMGAVGRGPSGPTAAGFNAPAALMVWYGKLPVLLPLTKATVDAELFAKITKYLEWRAAEVDRMHTDAIENAAIEIAGRVPAEFQISNDEVSEDDVSEG